MRKFKWDLQPSGYFISYLGNKIGKITIWIWFLHFWYIHNMIQFKYTIWTVSKLVTRFESILNYEDSDCGAIGRVVASVNRGPGFESRHF